jgi:hypothetical protein
MKVFGDNLFVVLISIIFIRSNGMYFELLHHLNNEGGDDGQEEQQELSEWKANRRGA